jgi:uncharacterized FlgJ-related protein
MMWTPEDEVKLNEMLERKKNSHKRDVVNKITVTLFNLATRFHVTPDAFEIEIAEQFEDTGMQLMGRPVGTPRITGKVYVIKEKL